MEEQEALELLEQQHGPAERAERAGASEPSEAAHGEPVAGFDLADLRRAIRDHLDQRPYLILGGLCGLGLAIGARGPGLGALARTALQSGLASLLGELTGGK